VCCAEGCNTFLFQQQLVVCLYSYKIIILCDCFLQGCNKKHFYKLMINWSLRCMKQLVELLCLTQSMPVASFQIIFYRWYMVESFLPHCNRNGFTVRFIVKQCRVSIHVPFTPGTAFWSLKYCRTSNWILEFICPVYITWHDSWAQCQLNLLMFVYIVSNISSDIFHILDEI
jgi:hypothetical protein